MAHAAAAQALDDDPPLSHDQFHRDAWLHLQSSLARTLDDLYLFCEDDNQNDLIQSTLRLLEETVDDFRYLASSSTAGSSSSCRSSSTAATTECSWGAQQSAAAAAADAAALISRKCSACGTSCCCSTGSSPADACCTPPNLGAAGWQPQGSSRLSKSSSLGCNMHSLDTCSRHTGCSRGGTCYSCTTSQAAASAALITPSCCDDTAAAQQNGLRSCGPHSCTASEVLHHQLHHKLSSPHRLRRSPSQTKAALDERHARAERLRERLAEARLARLQEQLAKQQRAASKAQEPAAGTSSPAAAVTAEKHQRSSLLRAAHLRHIRAKAEDESRKVDEVSFINNLTNAGRKADLQQRLEEGEARRAEALAAILAKQQEAAANVREAAERRRAAEAERLAQLEHRQRRKQEVQAKMEVERRAAIAAREAARAHARAVAQQRETARQQQATLLRDKVNVRLKQAAERRLQHLELIRERAALGKDFDRRDSFAGGPGSGRQSPVQFDRFAGKGSRPLRSPVPPEVPSSSGCSTEQEVPGLAAGPSSRACLSKANLQAAALCPASVSDISDWRQASVSQASTAAASVAPVPGLLPSEVFGQLKDHSQSIAAGGLVAAPSSLKAFWKGARRRMAKARYKMQQPRSCFQEPERAQELCQSAEGQQLLAAWVPHLAVLQIQQPVAIAAVGTSAETAAAAGTTAAAAAGPDQAAAAAGPDQAAAAAGPDQAAAAAAPDSGAPAGSAAAAAGPAEQLCACGSSSKSSSATNSPRSSTSSYTAASVSTSTFSSTIAGSPAGTYPANWVLSRSSSCCDCDSQHSASTGGVAAAAASQRSRAAAEEQQREALAALVASARSHLGKQQLLVGHLARRSGLLYRLCEEVLAACGDSADTAGAGSSNSSGGGGSVWQEAKARQERLQQAHLLELLGRLLELPANLDYLLACGQLLAAFVRCTRVALDQWNGLEAQEPSMVTGGVAASRLSMLLQVLVAVLEHTPSNAELVEIQEQLVGFTVAAGLMARLASVFSLFDQPMQQAARPVPPYVLQCLRLLGGLTAVRSPAEQLVSGRLWPSVTPNAAAVVLEMQATSMAGVLSLLTAVLLNASPTCTPAEASSRALPPNFVEAAHLVMAVLNNVCRLDLLAGQFMLSCSHHRMEFYHLISFLLSYCLSRWPAPLATCQAGGAAAGAGQLAGRPCPSVPSPPQQQQQRVRPAETGAAASSPTPSSSPAKGDAPRPPAVAPVLHHPIAQLLNQVLLLIGYFCVQHPSNQAMLTWGRSPSILQRLCSLPQDYLEVPELRAVLMPTLLCVCCGAERSCEIVARHFDLGLLLQYTQQQAAEQEALQQQQQHGQQQPQQTRKQRRRQRSAQREQQQQQVVQQAGQPTDLQLQRSQQDLQQQLPAQAQQLLQQVKQCGQTASSSGQDAGSGGSSDCGQSGGDTGAVGVGAGSAAGPESSSGGSSVCKGSHPSRGRHAMFALCRRFPVQLLAVAAQQLQGVCSTQQGLGACSSSSSLAPRQEQGAPAAAPAGCEMACACPQDCCTSSTDDQQQLQRAQARCEAMEPAAVSAAAAEQPGTAESVALQLSLQRSPAPKLVQCEVVTCS